MRELILIISALGLFQQAICQCVDFSIGNEWHYYATSYLDDVYNEHWYYSIVVSETLMVTDQHFENYAVVESPDAVSYLRADTLAVYKYDLDAASESMLYHFEVIPGDTTLLFGGQWPVISNHEMVVLGTTQRVVRISREYGWMGQLGSSKSYSTLFGVWSWESWWWADFDGVVKVGAIVDGIEYGDYLAIQDPWALPSSFEMSCFPNPFNATANFRCKLSTSGLYRLAIFNALGQFVTEIFHGDLPAGNHVFSFDGTQFSSGSYLVVLEGHDHVKAERITLIK
jgi:hypothetical protein